MKRRAQAALLSFVAAWALLVLPLLGRARAQVADPDVQRGVGLYNDLEYEQAVTVLSAAVAKPGLGHDDLVEGYKTLALSYVALGRDAAARTAFDKLLEADPKVDLPRTENPRALELFGQAKKAVKVVAPVRLSVVPDPAEPRAGQTIELRIDLGESATQVTTVTVHHRVRGRKAFSTMVAVPAEGGLFTANVSGAFVEGPAIEYFVTAEARDGSVVASDGSEEEPVSLLVREARSHATPIYAKWWFWAGVGGALAVGVAALALSSGGGSPSTPTDATVTISTNFGH